MDSEDKLDIYEEIVREKSDAIKDVKGKTKKAQKETKTLLSKTDATLEDGHKQILENVNRLNQGRIELQTTSKRKLSSAAKSLMSWTTQYKTNFEKRLGDIRKCFIFPITAIIIITTISQERLNSIHPILAHQFKGFVTLHLLLGLATIFLVLRTYFDTKKEWKINNRDLEISYNRLLNTDTALPEVSYSEVKYKKTLSLFNIAADVFGQVVATAEKFNPLVDKWYSQLDLGLKYKNRVEKYEAALKYYNLFSEGDTFFSRSKNKVPLKDRMVTEESSWDSRIIKAVLKELSNRGIKVTSNTIQLINNEYHGLSTKGLFREIMESEGDMRSLALVLLNSNKLPKSPKIYNYDETDLLRVLKEVSQADEFEISAINDLFMVSLRQIDYLKPYQEYLAENLSNEGINPDIDLTIEYILENRDTNKLTFETQLIDLAYKTGMKIFRDNFDSSDELIDGFARASVTLKFHDAGSLRPIACRLSADDYPAAIIKAYYQKGQEKQGEVNVKLSDLTKDLDLINQIIEDSPNDQEFQSMKSLLREGLWFDSYAAMRQEILLKEFAELKDINKIANKYPVLKEALNRIFRKVQFSTLEMAIDAQIFGVYIIMSTSRRGKFLNKLVDKLSKRNLIEGDPKRFWNMWYFRSDEEKQAIFDEYGIYPKYDFVSFSDNTRIGFLEKGSNFLEFKQEFDEDVKTMLSKHKGKQYEIGYVIQRIPPSQYSFGFADWSEDELGKLGNVRLKEFNVANYITQLAESYVDSSEKAGILRFETDFDIDLLTILDEFRIYDIVRTIDEDMPKTDVPKLRRPTLKEDILDRLKNEFAISSIGSLAAELEKGNISKEDVTPIIKDAMEKEGIHHNRSQTYANRFVGVLQEYLYILYEIRNR